MNRDEILVAPASDPGEGGVATAMQSLREGRALVRDRKQPSFVMQVLPQSQSLKIKLDAKLRELLQEAESTGNRPGGWNFASRYIVPEIKDEHMVLGSRVTTKVWEDGRILVEGPLDVFRDGARERTVLPTAISEFPVSIMRLAAKLYGQESSSEGSTGQQPFAVLVDLALLEASGWRLCPHPPGTYGYLLDGETRALPEGDAIRSRPFEFTAQEVVSSPDRCGQRVVRWIYQEFGFEEEKMLRNFDRTTGRLTFDR